ncbi:major facilitator superfamily domain-containing protein 6-like [Porphyrio hochstetteri]
MSEQWDVGRALALSGLFRLLQAAGRACAAPFLALYLRHLGLPAALVGVVAGAGQLAAALRAPLCCRCPRGRRTRRLLVAGSLLGSAGAGLLLTLVPPAQRDAGYRYCNASQQPAGRGAGTAGPGLGRSGPAAFSAVTGSGATSREAMPTTAGPAVAGGRPALPTAGPRGRSGPTDTPEGRAGGGDTKRNGHSDGPSGWTASVATGSREPGETQVPAAYRPPLPRLQKETGSPGSAAVDLGGSAEESLYATASHELSLSQTTLPAAGDAYVSGNTSDRLRDAQDASFWDREHQVFLMVLGAVVLWELLATSLEWAVDESLYEYLDFVDATDRYGRLWVWSYLGASAGACGIAALVDQLDCFLGGTVSRLAVHFYGYAVLITLSLLVSVFFPVHIPRKTERANRMGKALSLLCGDGRAILCALTVFLTGAAGSAAHNFLFWQLQDRGSSELYMGLSVAIGLLAEILLYPFKAKLLSTFSSSRIVAVSLSLLALQLLCYSFLWAAWSVLPIQLLSAFSHGALWWVVNMTVDDIATPGTERSLQALLQDLCHGGGASLGSFAGGFVVKYFGLAALYRAFCVALVLWLFLFSIIQSKLPRQKKINYSRLLAADSSDMSDSEEENERDWLVKAMKDESFSKGLSQQLGIN